MVPQMVALGVVASAGLWFALRWMRGEFARVDSEIRRTKRIMERMHGAPALNVEFDPQSGQYRPFVQ